MLVCRDAASEIDFCKTAFGAVELSHRPAPDGAVVHATLTIGEAMIMVHGEFPNLASRAPQSDGSSSVVIYIYVEDVATVIDRAVAAGAKVLLPATNTFWGDRVEARLECRRSHRSEEGSASMKHLTLSRSCWQCAD
jgi:PhnB protein